MIKYIASLRAHGKRTAVVVDESGVVRSSVLPRAARIDPRNRKLFLRLVKVPYQSLRKLIKECK